LYQPGARSLPAGSEGELAWRIDRDDLVTTVMLHGRLDLRSAQTLGAVLSRCVAECPAAVVVDMSTIRVGDDRALRVFPSAVRGDAGFPPVPLLVCGGDGDLGEPLRRLAVTRVFPTRAAARAAATTPAALANRLATRLTPGRTAPAEGRACVEQACRGWNLPEVLSHARVVASELCANATSHGRPPLRLVVVRTDTHLHLVVRDGSERRPELRERPHDGEPMESGNGLYLVSAFVSGWGVRSTADGKAVSAALPLSG
jgi:anti-sigma regulatory factor (Ser/Thr protein kinase)